MKKFCMYFYLVMGTIFLVAAYILNRDMTPGWTFFAIGQIACILDMK